MLTGIPLGLFPPIIQPRSDVKVVETIWRKPATAADALTDAEDAGPNATVKKTSLLHDLTHLGLRNTLTIAQALTTLSSGEPINDRELLLEHGVSMLQSLPANSTLGSGTANALIGMLWKDLPHPAGTICGPSAKYRSADGSGNNLWCPELGKAGSPYSRSVPPSKPKSPSLPDPELVFDQLLRRRGPFREHPSGLNRLFFSFATIVIHECFQTSRNEPWINETSSYVDLSTLYGNTYEQQKRVRTFENGLIFPDAIASDRIMMMPPGVVAVLLMFSRNHNHIANRLRQINESGKYIDLEKATDEQRTWQDEDIFQLSRNINVGWFASVVLKDYVAAILNTVRANSTWSLNLGAEIKELGGGRLERGTGNVVSVEFAVLYHWHAALSAADDKWMQYVLKRDFPDSKVEDITPYMFWQVAEKHAAYFRDTPPSKWTFDGIERQKDGTFSNVQIAELIKSCIEEPAHAFGARGTPSSLKIVDVMGQLQARGVFNVCTMNEFRRYLNLTEYKSFEEWNPDKEIAAAAERLYGHIDNLELYPGLMAEDTKPPIPGSGVCPGQTTGRGILDDAVALVRGDRFLTFDFNSSTLTNWGLASLVPHGGSYGGVLSSLLFQGLPDAWTGTSSYALLPFYTPKAVKKILKDNKVLGQYGTERPKSGQKLHAIHSYDAVKAVFKDRDSFRTIYQKAIRNVTIGHEFMIGWDDSTRHDARSEILHKAFFEPNFEAGVTEYFRKTVKDLIKKRSLAFSDSPRRQIDVVRDVTDVAPIMWVARRFAIPLKTEEHPRGLISVPELFGILLVLFIYCSFNIIPKNEWDLRQKAMEVSPLLRSILEAQIRSHRGIAEKLVDWISKGGAYEVGPEAERMYHALAKSNLPIGDIVGDCIGMMIPVAGNITQQASLLIDLYLSEGYEEYKKRIIDVAKRDDAEAEDEMLGWVFEGMRHAGIVPGIPRLAARDAILRDGDRTLDIKAGDLVLIATSKASMDPKYFPDPEKLDPYRPRNSYILLGDGLHYCFGARLIGSSLGAILKEVFRLKNVRRAPGSGGRLASIEEEIAEGVKAKLYIDRNATETPIPTSMRLEYDEESTASSSSNAYSRGGRLGPY
ncbi:linoleate diol synthase [Violaceomyces palustris]|uniref:Linoleate diol synthase n=1 Tax=Violaceomyces palustris TaxID=1673888 RepID=A0ACD0NZ29_9BASI|nr:linoleate diol synthase [Violaceomyces palustris]